jgi:hypothetical protein
MLKDNEKNIIRNFEISNQEIKNEINNLKTRNAQLEEQNIALNSTCANLENVVYLLKFIQKKNIFIT